LTSIFFIRHAQPDTSWKDDRTRPLTTQGFEDSNEVSTVLSKFNINLIYSSPYKRSFDTIADFAKQRKMTIHTDERFKERKGGINHGSFLQERWNDFAFCEENGETLGSVQKRNIAALTEVIKRHPHKNVAIGTHGTALSVILNYYDSSFDIEYFKQIWFCMPYILRVVFKNESIVKTEEILRINRGY